MGDKYPLLQEKIPEIVNNEEFKDDFSSDFHLRALDRIFFCASKYIPPHIFNKENLEHQILQKQCNNWNLKIFPNQGELYETIPGVINYHVNELFRWNNASFKQEISIQIYKQYLSTLTFEICNQLDNKK